VEYLTPELISGMLREQAIRKTNRRKGAKVIDGSVYSGKPATEQVGGRFYGKQGTIRRSRKGATRIQPNGRRYYIAPEPWNYPNRVRYDLDPKLYGHDRY
jgi:hypothetical protein